MATEVVDGLNSAATGLAVVVLLGVFLCVALDVCGRWREEGKLEVRFLGNGALSISAVVVASSVVLKVVPRFQKMPDLFFTHIAGMLSAWLLLVCGVLAYSIGHVKWPASTGMAEMRTRNRTIHAVFQCLATGAALVGFYGIYRNHQLAGASQFALGNPVPLAKMVHVWLGWAIVLWLSAQFALGWFKLLGLNKGLIRARSHNQQGFVILALATLNILVILPYMPALLIDGKTDYILQGLVFVVLAIVLALAAKRTGVAAREQVADASWLRVDGDDAERYAAMPGH